MSGSQALGSSPLELFSALQLAAAGTTGTLCALSAAFVAAVAVAARRVPSVAPFTQLWGPRLVLHAVAALALGAQLLRLPSWWAVPAAWTPGTPRDAQVVLCRLAVCVPYGWALPQLAALAVAIVARPPREADLPTTEPSVPRRRRRSNTRTVLLAGLAALPVAVAQTLLAFHDPIFGAGGGLRHSFGPRWLDVVADAPACGQNGGGCPASRGGTPVSCVPPLLSSALSGVVAILFGGVLLWHCRKLAAAAVSRQLARRARLLGTLLMAAPLASAALRCVATLSAPQRVVWEALLAAELAAVIVQVTTAVVVLSVQPSVGAAAAAAAVGWAAPGGASSRGEEGNSHALLRPLLGLPASTDSLNSPASGLASTSSATASRGAAGFGGGPPPGVSSIYAPPGGIGR